MAALTPRTARDLRRRNRWSLQQLASLSGINKPYLSEFENGLRSLAEPQLQRLAAVLHAGAPPGTPRPQLRRENGYDRLVFVDAAGVEISRPARAFLEWEEADGTAYRMFVGERDPEPSPG